MAVMRVDLDKCVGCGNCVKFCPQDVFRFDTESNKSVIAYPEECQICGQCYVYCLGRSLGLNHVDYYHPITNFR